MSDAKKKWMREWRLNNKEAYAEQRKSWRARNPTTALLEGARKRAKVAKIEFFLTPSDVVVPSHCPVLGIPLKVSRGTPSDNSPSLDRIDNSRGYVKGNIRVISNRANSLKKDATLGEVLAIYEYMLNEHQVTLEGR